MQVSIRSRMIHSMNAIQTTAGDFARQALRHGSGEVLAVFDSSVHLANRQGHCCLIAPWLPDGPLNVRLVSRTWPALEPGDKWQFRVDERGCGQLYIAGRLFPLGILRAWRPPAPRTPIQAVLRARLRALQPCLEAPNHIERRVG